MLADVGFAVSEGRALGLSYQSVDGSVDCREARGDVRVGFRRGGNIVCELEEPLVGRLVGYREEFSLVVDGECVEGDWFLIGLDLGFFIRDDAPECGVPLQEILAM